MILCECGEFIDGCKFRVYIKTSANPSTPSIGHKKCGLIFDFVDGKMPKRYSSRIELKSLAVKYAEKNELILDKLDLFLLEVDRLKSTGTYSDMDILTRASKNLLEENKIWI